jgi:hypothetical protein
MSDCQTDAECAQYLDCLLRCPVDEHGNADASCEQSCPAGTSPEATELQSSLRTCRIYGAGFDCMACAVSVSAIVQQECPAHAPAPTACRQCYWDHCCRTWDACYAEGVNPDCDALAICIMACSTSYEPCVQACFGAHRDSVTTLLRQQACGLSLCAADQPDCNIGLRDACDSCLYGECQSSFVLLLSTADGYLAWLCMADCGSSGAPGTQCVDDCINAYPAVDAAVSAWAECIDINCSTSC